MLKIAQLHNFYDHICIISVKKHYLCGIILQSKNMYNNFDIIGNDLSLSIVKALRTSVLAHTRLISIMYACVSKKSKKDHRQKKNKLKQDKITSALSLTVKNYSIFNGLEVISDLLLSEEKEVCHVLSAGFFDFFMPVDSFEHDWKDNSYIFIGYKQKQIYLDFINIIFKTGLSSTAESPLSLTTLTQSASPGNFVRHILMPHRYCIFGSSDNDDKNSISDSELIIQITNCPNGVKLAA